MTKKSTKTKLKRKPVAKPVTVEVDSDALLTFLAKRAGGVDRATKAFIRDTTAALVRSGATFGAIVAQAGAEGWGPVLAATPVKSVLAATPAAKSTGKGRNGDLSKLREAIKSELSDGEPHSAADLANGLDEDRKRLTRQLIKLTEAGKVKATGSRRNRRYSLVQG